MKDKKRDERDEAEGCSSQDDTNDNTDSLIEDIMQEINPLPLEKQKVIWKLLQLFRKMEE